MHLPFKKLTNRTTPDIFELHRRANEHAQRSEWNEEYWIRVKIWNLDQRDPVALYQLGESYNVRGDRDMAERCFRLAINLGYPQEDYDDMYG